jgi:hypothetical protein
MNHFLIIGLLGLVAACNSSNQDEAFREQVNSLQLNFKKPHQPANDWVLDSLQSIRTKQWYAVAERKLKGRDE